MCVCDATLSVVGGAVWHSLFPDDPSTSLTSLGVAHGDLLFMAYDMERQVEPAYKPGPLDSNRPFGSHVTVSGAARCAGRPDGWLAGCTGHHKAHKLGSSPPDCHLHACYC